MKPATFRRVGPAAHHAPAGSAPCPPTRRCLAAAGVPAPADTQRRSINRGPPPAPPAVPCVSRCGPPGRAAAAGIAAGPALPRGPRRACPPVPAPHGCGLPRPHRRKHHRQQRSAGAGLRDLPAHPPAAPASCSARTPRSLSSALYNSSSRA